MNRPCIGDRIKFVKIPYGCGDIVRVGTSGILKGVREIDNVGERPTVVVISNGYEVTIVVNFEDIESNEVLADDIWSMI